MIDASIDYVLDAVLDVLPADTVARAYGVSLDGVEHPTVMVYWTDLVPPNVACPTLTVSIDVLVITHLREPGTGDSELHALVEGALAGIGTLPHARWTSAEHLKYLDSWPAARIPVEVTL